MRGPRSGVRYPATTAAHRARKQCLAGLTRQSLHFAYPQPRAYVGRRQVTGIHPQSRGALEGKRAGKRVVAARLPSPPEKSGTPDQKGHDNDRHDRDQPQLASLGARGLVGNSSAHDWQLQVLIQWLASILGVRPRSLALGATSIKPHGFTREINLLQLTLLESSGPFGLSGANDPLWRLTTKRDAIAVRCRACVFELVVFGSPRREVDSCATDGPP